MQITLAQWSDFNLPITLRNPSLNGVQGTPINLTGCAAIGFVFKGYAASARVPFNFLFDLDRTSGKLTAILTATQTGGIAYGLYLYEIKLFDSLGKVIRILKGQVNVEAGSPNA